MTQAVAVRDGSQAVLRPLSVLVPLIKDNLAQGREAAEKAGMPYYQAVGELLLEAKAQMKHGEFTAWVERNFNIKIRQAMPSHVSSGAR